MRGRKDRLLLCVGAVLRGWLFNAAGIGLTLGSMALNARYTPAVPWFPLVGFAVAIGGARWAQRRWQIGLTLPDGVNWGRMGLLGTALIVGGVCVCVLQGAYHGYTRDEHAPPGLPAAFSLAYTFSIPLVIAIIAETAFRGIMQTGLQRALAVWPAILAVAAINVVSHRWEEFSVQWLGLFVTLAGLGYLRWISGSLIPPLTAHVLTNLLLTLANGYFGPLRQGNLSAVALGLIAGLAAVSFAGAFVFSRGIRRPATAYFLR